MITNPVPGSSQGQSSSSRTVVISDDRAICALIDALLSRSGFSTSELARQIGIKPQTLSQYKHGYRTNPSLKWIIRLAEISGARLTVEWPSDKPYLPGPRGLL